jgi:hypothetical protein
MKRAWLLLLPLSLACIQPAKPYAWEGHGLTLRAVEIHGSDERYADYRLEVSDGKLTYCYGSGAMGTSRERLNSFGNVLEADGFVFVPASCGGGNASKCQGWEVFRAQGGLKWLGNITGKWDGQKAVPYEAGLFYDTGDMLEINDLLNHAQSPRFTMAYGFDGHALKFDAAKTWDLNAEQYKTAQDDAPGLLFRAGLAKLCGKTAELKTVQASVDKTLSTLGRQLFAKSLGQVQNANITPSAFIPVGQCPPDGKS